MTSLGVHFALTSDLAEALLGADDPDKLMELVDDIEENSEEADRVESDKAWDAIHRCLSDGTLDYDGGTYPLSHTVLGGADLDAGEDYFVRYLTPEQVGDVARALAPLDEAWMRERYFALDPDDYDGPHNEDDFGYTWANFVDVRAFFAQHEQSGKAVIFTVDQ